MKGSGASGKMARADNAGERNAGDAFEVRDARAIKLLANPYSRQFLAPFCGRLNTVSQAAQQLGLSLNLTYRWTQRLLQANLLRAEQHPSAGRRFRQYRMVADALKIQVHLVPLEELLKKNLDQHRQLQEAMLKAFLQANEPDWFYHVRLENNRMVFRTHDGQLHRDDSSESGPPVMSHWFRVKLDLGQANRLSQELQALQDRFKSEEQLARGPTLEYTVHLGLVPILPE